MKKWAFILLCFQAVYSYCQNPIGLPGIISYTRNIYNGGLQNRGVVQDANGILYFGNSEGLLSFDGTYWRLYPLPNKTMVRSIAIGTDKRIYVGGQNEMGYFSPGINGDLSYTSIKSLVPPGSAAFRDVWNVVNYKNRVFFRSVSSIFEYDGRSVKAYPAPAQWQYLANPGDELIAQDARNGLMTFAGGKWSAIGKNASLPSNAAVFSIVNLGKDSMLIATLKNGLFVLAGNKLSTFKLKGTDPFLNQQVMCALVLDTGHIAIGTHMGGCYIIDKSGNILQNFSRRDGLQNNTVLSLFSDRDHNIWLGLDDGIDHIAYNSAIKHIYPERLNEGAGYSSIVFDHTLYIGTSNWLYQLQLTGNDDLSTTSGEFKPVAGTKGSAWGLFNVNNNLLLAHHEGAFQVKNKVAVSVNNHTGFWNFSNYTGLPGQDVVVAGNYNGLALLGYEHNKFIQKAATNFNESSRFVLVDKNNIWVAHPYKGIFKVSIQSPNMANSKLYTEKNGLPSNLRNRVFRIKGSMAVATEKGIYTYNSASDRFEPSAKFEPIFGRRDIRYLKEDPSGNIWFIEKNTPGVVDYSGASPKLLYFPELNGQLVSDFENIYPLNDRNIFIGAEKGFYHINYQQYKRSQANPSVLIRMVKAFGKTDTVLNAGYHYELKERAPQLNYHQNSLHFEYSSPSYQQLSSVEYSYRLKGFDDDWSDPSKRAEKDYTNLPAGNFTFEVKARGNGGESPAVSAYTFIILPPWYQTGWAWLAYMIMFVIFNYAGYLGLKAKFRKLKKKHDDEQKRLKYLYELEIERSEKEIILLKNEKLIAEIEGKNSELASVAMHLLQKSELLSRLRDELVRLKKATNEDMQSEELKKVIRILNQESKMDKEWDQFAAYFDNIHSDLLKDLRETHPTLNANELKLCAYLRMNLSTKEIAQLMNISVRGVEISRYRLRKKLQVPTETNLFKYFTAFSAEKKEMV